MGKSINDIVCISPERCGRNWLRIQLNFYYNKNIWIEDIKNSHYEEFYDSKAYYCHTNFFDTSFQNIVKHCNNFILLIRHPLDMMLSQINYSIYNNKDKKFNIDSLTLLTKNIKFIQRVIEHLEDKNLLICPYETRLQYQIESLSQIVDFFLGFTYMFEDKFKFRTKDEMLHKTIKKVTFDFCKELRPNKIFFGQMDKYKKVMSSDIIDVYNSYIKSLDYNYNDLLNHKRSLKYR